MSAPVKLERGRKDCFFCPSGKKDTISCYYHKEQKNVLNTYLQDIDYLEGIPSGNVWVIVQKLHKVILCPISQSCDKVSVENFIKIFLCYLKN